MPETPTLNSWLLVGAWPRVLRGAQSPRGAIPGGSTRGLLEALEQGCSSDAKHPIDPLSASGSRRGCRMFVLWREHVLGPAKCPHVVWVPKFGHRPMHSGVSSAVAASRAGGRGRQEMAFPAPSWAAARSCQGSQPRGSASSVENTEITPWRSSLGLGGAGRAARLGGVGPSPPGWAVREVSSPS